MNGNPTAAQKRFHQWCRDYGCVISSSPDAAIHHINGSKMKLKGCSKPGEWYVIPLCYFWHQDGSNENAVHVNRNNFVYYGGKTEKELWVYLISIYEQDHGHKPMPEHEYDIIVARA